MTNIRFSAFTAAGPKPRAPGKNSWDSLMRIALDMAKDAAQYGDVPVGAVVVDPHGQIITQAGNCVEKACDPTAHAEIVALRQAASKIGNNRLLDCILVVTLEPCQMCAGAIKLAGLAGVVFGARDNQAGAIVSRQDFYDAPGPKIWHLGGILSHDCAKVLSDFFQARRKQAVWT